MPHIKWLGIIKDDLGRYQRGDLPPTAKKVDMYNVYKVLKGTPRGCMLQFNEDRLYYYEREN